MVTGTHKAKVEDRSFCISESLSQTTSLLANPYRKVAAARAFLCLPRILISAFDGIDLISSRPR